MGCAIAQIVKVFSLAVCRPQGGNPEEERIGTTTRRNQPAKNKNGNARTAAAIRAFPFRFWTKLSGKKFPRKESLVIELLQPSFGEKFPFSGGYGGRHNVDFVAWQWVGKGDKSRNRRTGRFRAIWRGQTAY